jgi:hypothetical protein
MSYEVKALFGIESINALHSLLFSDGALMQLVGFNAHQVRRGICQRGTTKRQGDRSHGPMCPDTLAKDIVKWHLRDLEMVFHRAIRALAMAGVFGAKVTGISDGTDLATTERYTGCGQVTRTVRLEDTRGQVHAIKVTVYGWNVFLLIDAAAKMSLAVKVGQIHEHEALWPGTWSRKRG